LTVAAQADAVTSSEPIQLTCSAEVIASRIGQARQQITERGRSDVAVVAVTKSWPRDCVDAAVRAGCDAIGENYAAEVVAKMTSSPAGRPVLFIGQLQTNKVRHIVGLVSCVQTVDRQSLVSALASRSPGLSVLVQVNVDNEPGKGGCATADVEGLVESASAAGLRVDGLMTVAPTTGGWRTARPVFRTVRRMADLLGLRECSMGMSDDFLVAVDEGSTQVRLGSLLFGSRPVSATHGAVALPPGGRG
jgi:PLP dependent protein